MKRLNVLECPKMDWTLINEGDYSFSCPRIKWHGYIPPLSDNCQITFNACDDCKHNTMLKEMPENYEKEEPIT